MWVGAVFAGLRVEAGGVFAGGRGLSSQAGGGCVRVRASGAYVLGKREWWLCSMGGGIDHHDEPGITECSQGRELLSATGQGMGATE